MNKLSSARPQAGPAQDCPPPSVLPTLALLALVGGFFTPWFDITYFGLGPFSFAALDLAGGALYAVALAGFVLTTLVDLSRGRRGSQVTQVLSRVLTAYTAFWLALEVILDLGSGSPFHPTFGFGLVASFAGSVLGVLASRPARQTDGAPAPVAPDTDLVVAEASGRSYGLIGRDEFAAHLSSATAQAVDGRLALVVVRLDLPESDRRHGPAAADQISAAVSHRLRAQLRTDDMVTASAPGKFTVLLSGNPSEEMAGFVALRLASSLATPPPALPRRLARLYAVSVTLEVVGDGSGSNDSGSGSGDSGRASTTVQNRLSASPRATARP